MYCALNGAAWCGGCVAIRRSCMLEHGVEGGKIKNNIDKRDVKVS